MISAVTGAAHVLLERGDGAMLGASGVVFMNILLNSFVNFRVGRVPLTSVLTALLFLGKELSAMRANPKGGVSFLAHLTGGVAGAILGYLVNLGLARKASRGVDASSGDSSIVNAAAPRLVPQPQPQPQPGPVQPHLHAA